MNKQTNEQMNKPTIEYMKNQQINKIRKELEFVCKTLSHLKSNTEEMTNTYINEVDIINSHIKTIRFNELAELRKKIDGISSMQKHIVDTRNMLMQMLDTNMKIIKKEVSELRNNKHIIRSIVEEEIKEYFSKKELSK
jgi:translation elongation factor EF-Ts